MIRNDSIFVTQQVNKCVKVPSRCQEFEHEFKLAVLCIERSLWYTKCWWSKPGNVWVVSDLIVLFLVLILSVLYPSIHFLSALISLLSFLSFSLHHPLLPTFYMYLLSPLPIQSYSHPSCSSDLSSLTFSFPPIPLTRPHHLLPLFFFLNFLWTKRCFLPPPSSPVWNVRVRGAALQQSFLSFPGQSPPTDKSTSGFPLFFPST